MKKETVYSNLKLIFIFIIAGWLLYSPMTSNYLTNPDGIILGLIYKPWSEGADFGRIGIRYVDQLMGRVVSPNMMLMISLFLYALVILLLASIFEVKSKVYIFLMGAVLLLMPNTSSIFTYYYCMVSYCLAFLMSVMACWVIVKEKHGKSILSGSILILIQCMLYQAYLSVTVVICCMYLLFMILKKTSVKEVGVKSCQMLSMGIVGCFLYLFVLKVVPVSLSSARGFDRMGQIEVSKIPSLIQEAYHNFFQYFGGNELLNNDWMFRKQINGIVFLWLILGIVYKVVRDRLYLNWISLLLLLGIIVVLPLGFELMTIIAPEVDSLGTTGILLIPAMVLVYMAVIFLYPSLLEKDKKEKYFGGGYIKYSWMIVLIPLLWNLYIYTNAFQNVMWLNYNSTYALCSKISERIDMVQYGPQTKILIGGSPENGNYPCQYEELKDIVKGSLAVKGMVWQGGWLSNVCYQDILRDYFNISYEITTSDEYQSIITSKEYAEMAIFPDIDSVKEIDDIIIIKLSE